MKNSLIIAAAGSGKTTYIVNKALSIQDEKCLITTFTEANEREIRKKIIKINGSIPPNIVVQTWFSFLLQHGVRPYQSFIYEGKVNGLLLVNQKSGLKKIIHGKPFYYGEKDLPEYYFNKSMQIYSDKLAKFVCRVDEMSEGLIINRLMRIYPYIFIDEVQDLAGYDLEIVKLLLNSKSNIIMVGDPRQVTYHTHYETQNKKYLDGRIEEFIKMECKNSLIQIDKSSLSISHRNKKDICEFANQLYPEYVPCGYESQPATEHDGVYFVKPRDVDGYLKKYSPMQLRDNKTVKINTQYGVMNFGAAKGLTFDRVLIYPTKPMLEWIIDHSKKLAPKSRSNLYVAITRARHSVGIVFDDKKGIGVEGIRWFEDNSNIG